MVYTEDFGEAEKGELILVHGLGEHFRRHRRLIEKAKEHGYRVHAFDWPGHGKSKGPRGHARIEQAMDILNDLVEDAEGEPFLFGHSLGGLTVLRYAEEDPHKVKGVISSSPPLKKSEDLSIIAIKLISFLSHIFPKKTITNSLDIEDVTRSEEARKRYIQDDMLHDKISLALLRDIFKDMKKAHERKDRLDCPLLLMAGTEDKICPIEGAERFTSGLDEDKELQKFEGAYHEIFNDPEWKEEFHEEIIEWMESYS